jgi:hypothetical protein
VKVFCFEAFSQEEEIKSAGEIAKVDSLQLLMKKQKCSS